MSSPNERNSALLHLYDGNTLTGVISVVPDPVGVKLGVVAEGKQVRFTLTRQQIGTILNVLKQNYGKEKT